MKRNFTLLFFLVSVACFGQKIRLVTESDLPGCRVTRNDTFSGQGLDRYVTNGAGLYLEYGCKKLYIDEFVIDQEMFSLEVFVMKDAPSAFGIYSQSISRCMMMNRLGTFSCTTPNKISVAFGPFFINALNRGGSREGIRICEQMITAFIANNPQETWYAPPLFQEQKLSPFLGTLKYYTGPMAILNGVPGWSEMLENMTFEMYTLQLSNPSFTGTLARIVFLDASDVRTFQMRAGLNPPNSQLTPVMTVAGVYRSWLQVNDTKIIFLEGSSSTVKITDFVSQMPNISW